MALQNTCLLLNPNFLEAKQSSSFILTKIEDKDYDKETFNDQMDSLKEDFSEEHIGPIINHFDSINTYLFCREEPNVEEGGRLKDTILADNQFFAIDEEPSKLLSSRYAEVIIGKDNLKEFKGYVSSMLAEIG